MYVPDDSCFAQNLHTLDVNFHRFLHRTKTDDNTRAGQPCFSSWILAPQRRCRFLTKNHKITKYHSKKLSCFIIIYPLFLGPPLPLTLTAAEDPKKRRGSWFRRAAEGQADPGGVFIDAAHGVGAPKMEALAKVGW